MSETATYAPSVRALIADLGIGESYAKCERIELELLSKHELVTRTAALRNNVAAAARRASSDTGNDYAVDTVKCLTARQDFMLIAVVTRRH